MGAILAMVAKRSERGAGAGAHVRDPAQRSTHTTQDRQHPLDTRIAIGRVFETLS